MIDFLAGAVTLGYGVAAVFFLRFWRKTGDRLFAIFALAFWILGVHWIVLAWTGKQDEVNVALYAIRLVAFLLILIAIIDKNRSARAG